MIRRHIGANLTAAIGDTPVVLLVGARQTGKSTIARTLVPKNRYVTLDDATTLASAKADPTAFVEQFDTLVAIDEVQRVPELFLAMKAVVDRRRRPGRFLLTGSANVLMIPRIADSLVGRMEILTLWPLSQGEIARREEGFLDVLSGDRLPSAPLRTGRMGILDRVLRGGYPVAYRRDETRRRAWFGSYVTGVLQRDIRDLANIEGLTALPRLLALLAAQTSGLLNLASINNAVGISYTTLQRYMSLLQTTFLIRTVPAWSKNLGKRATKTPKVLFGDTGLAASLLGFSRTRLETDQGVFGRLFENFVTMELVKQASWHPKRPEVFHFRSQKGAEVDVVLEVDGRIIGVEVKAAENLSGDDFRGLSILEDMVGRRFHRGIVLYTGKRILPFGQRLHAVPASALWKW
jgi:predicted AAA+ superfamily ATPase